MSSCFLFHECLEWPICAAAVWSVICEVCLWAQRPGFHIKTSSFLTRWELLRRVCQRHDETQRRPPTNVWIAFLLSVLLLSCHSAPARRCNSSFQSSGRIQREKKTCCSASNLHPLCLDCLLIWFTVGSKSLSVTLVCVLGWTDGHASVF